DMRRSIGRSNQTGSLDAWEWLFLLPGDTQVLGSGPREGCLHVAGLASGGQSARRHTFIVGMDDGRFPGPIVQDPVLLDGGRQKLSRDLATAASRHEESLCSFARMLAGLRGEATFSFSCRDLVDDREMFPSPALLSIFRIVSGKHDADHRDLLKALSRAA